MREVNDLRYLQRFDKIVFVCRQKREKVVPTAHTAPTTSTLLSSQSFA